MYKHQIAYDLNLLSGIERASRQFCSEISPVLQQGNVNFGYFCDRLRNKPFPSESYLETSLWSESQTQICVVVTPVAGRILNAITEKNNNNRAAVEVTKTTRYHFIAPKTWSLLEYSSNVQIFRRNIVHKPLITKQKQLKDQNVKQFKKDFHAAVKKSTKIWEREMEGKVSGLSRAQVNLVLVAKKCFKCSGIPAVLK